MPACAGVIMADAGLSKSIDIALHDAPATKNNLTGTYRCFCRVSSWCLL
jgi:hypothetical protein